MVDYVVIFKRTKALADGTCAQLKTLREMRLYDQLNNEQTVC